LRHYHGSPRKLLAMRDRETIASELRLIAAPGWSAAELGAPTPRIEPADQLLDEWLDGSLRLVCSIT
jgi:hypothetical protein